MYILTIILFIFVDLEIASCLEQSRQSREFMDYFLSEVLKDSVLYIYNIVYDKVHLRIVSQKVIVWIVDFKQEIIKVIK